MNKQKFKSTAKKTGQYGFATPAIFLGTFGYATYLGTKTVLKTTSKVVRGIAVDSFNNTVKYVEEVKTQPEQAV